MAFTTVLCPGKKNPEETGGDAIEEGAEQQTETSETPQEEGAEGATE